MKMKINLWMIIASLLIISSCGEDDREVFTSALVSGPTVQELDITRVVLDVTNTNNPAVTIRWSAADYGTQVPINYSIEIASSSTFDNAFEAANVESNTSLTWTVRQLNDAVDAIGLAPLVEGEVFLRVTSSVGTMEEQPSTSNTISFDVVPFFSYPFEDYYLVGNATPPNWQNNNNNPLLFRDPSNQNSYSYTGRFLDFDPEGGPAEGFKILEIRGEWQPQWGLKDGLVDVNPDDQGDPAAFSVAEEGYYTFTINFAARTSSFEAFTGETDNTLTSLSIDGTGVVGGPVELTTVSESSSNYVFDEPHIWYVSSVELQAGELQFTANGTDAWGGDTSFSGTATLGGGNIPVVVGDDYEVWFNSLTGEYIMRPINLAGN